MIRAYIADKIQDVVNSLLSDGTLPRDDYSVIEIEDTKNPEHGDYACNFAMKAAKKAGHQPRELAELIRERLVDEVEFSAIDIAGPGFLNLKLEPAFVTSFIPKIVSGGTEGLAKGQVPVPQRINVEFVSVNPNGPITVGSARGAAFGDTLCRVLQAAGHTVHKEYYINDGVNSEQMRQFAASVQSYVEGLPFPEKGYKGDYVQEVAALVKPLLGQKRGDDLTWYQQVSQDLMLQRQRTDLELFGVTFDTWFSEQSLHESGQVEGLIADLTAKGVADDEPYRTLVKTSKGGAIDSVEREVQEANDEEGSGDGRTLWLRSTKFGDDMDRVLRRRDGRLTYISSDVAYHKDKFNRPVNADRLITILGPDHHGYIGRLHAVLAALEMEPKSLEGEPLTPEEAVLYASPAERDACRIALEKARKELEVIIFQIVRFVKEGQPAPMRKRDGNIYSLRDLIQEVGRSMNPTADEVEQNRIGADVTRYFYLMRSHDTHMDFDIDLATKQSDENPVFYVQYAHARIASIIRKAAEQGLTPGTNLANQLVDPRELALIRRIVDLPYEVERAATDYGVHRLATWAQELARAFHFFYDGCKVIQPNQPELSRARLALCEATQIGLRAVFGLIGISSPERMDRVVLNQE